MEFALFFLICIILYTYHCQTLLSKYSWSSAHSTGAAANNSTVQNTGESSPPDSMGRDSLVHSRDVHLRCPKAFNWSGFAGAKMPMTELVCTACHGWSETYSYILPCIVHEWTLCVSIHECKFPPWHFSNSSPSYWYNGSNYNCSLHRHPATTMIYSLGMCCIYTIFQTILLYFYHLDPPDRIFSTYLVRL